MKIIYKKFLIIVVMLGLMTACAGSGGTNVVVDDDEPCATVEECGGGPDTVAAGQNAMATQDFSEAESTYCDAYDDGDTGSTVAFGCFLTKLALLPEQSDFTTILTSLGQESIDFENDILEDVIESWANEDDNGFDAFNYLDYAHLPLVDILTSEHALTNKLAMIVNFLEESGTSAADFQEQLLALEDEYEYMETLLDSVIDDANFGYTIPEETFSTDSSLTVSYNDARLFMGYVKGTIVSLNVFAAYDYGVTVEDILSSDEDIDYETLVEDLNGTGATVGSVTVDEVAFLTMNDSALITDNQQRFIDAMDYLQTAFENIADGDHTMFEDSFEDITDYTATIDLFSHLKDSAETDAMVEMGSLLGRDVELNLYQFFTNPPQGSDVTGSDPFIYDEDNDQVELVEAYFQDLLTDIAAF